MKLTPPAGAAQTQPILSAWTHMFKSLTTLAASVRRVAATDRGLVRELRRIADALEATTSRGVALRTYYRDDRPGAVDDAALFAQTDADFAELERRELAKRSAGAADALDDSLDDQPDEEWR